jgi:pantoate--beta-alanine ligase
MTTMAEKIQMKLELSSITAWGTNELNANGFKTEYISIAKANTMETIENIDSSESMVILVAAFLDGVRLIDNLTIA